jgi:hypothetical protein
MSLHLDKLNSLKNKGEYLLAIFVLLVAGIFVLFYKPNPIIKVNWNKVRIKSGNSVITLEAPDAVSGVGKKFIVEVVLDTKGSTVNAVQSYIEFDPRVLEIIKTETKDSFCKFYPENNFSNDIGLVKLSCGAPYPGFKGKNTIQSIEFMTKSFRTTKVSVSDESLVLANDGKGTNLLTEFDYADINIKAAF